MSTETNRDTSSTHADASTSTRQPTNHSTSDLLDALRDLGDFLNRTPTRSDVANDDRYTVQQYQTQFGSFDAALGEAGLRSLGCRENFWADDDPEALATATGHTECEGTSPEEAKAHTILRSGADLLCPECVTERNVAAKLTAPEVYVPKEVETSFGTVKLHVLRHRRRTCRKCGYVSFGGILADRPAAEFMNLIHEVLSALDVPPSRERKLVSDAKARKHRGDMHDQKIMEQFVADLPKSNS